MARRKQKKPLKSSAQPLPSSSKLSDSHINMRIAVFSAEAALHTLEQFVADKHAAATEAKAAGQDSRHEYNQSDIDALNAWFPSIDKLYDFSMRLRVLKRQLEINRPTTADNWRLDNEYFTKRQIAKEINEDLREVNAAIAHPETGEPCIIYSIASYDLKGRFTLESLITKKRSGSYKSLMELFPIRLVYDPPRKKSGSANTPDKT